LLELSLVVYGFFFTSLMFYFNHRFIGHGPLGKWPLLRHMRRLHLMHHRNDYNEKRNNHLLLPFWAKLSFMVVFILISYYVSFFFASGYIGYVLYYGWQHHKIHNHDKSSYCSQHHYTHHRKSIKHNFSGTMPFIDILFGTHLK
jgi:sterol desaturase/sphingolipid hydroxylase (fatty acid hydroxylase superfamily)